ncbi:cytochrome c [Mariprofundus erugo]|uniref:Cytochrome c n=1 Tax=Mariprofundus erugo TaxID=2528639 RepID=A0A5R9GNM0_9PROT|nr:cytochrome c [Mariprofundus erugo]TLS67590.1 cytochrome c [Mariprofundus erugo]TLS74815.1 cytochrome c [Mariprofundus erugo]
MKKSFVLLATTAIFALTSQVAMAEVDAQKIFDAKCKGCHKVDGKKVGPGFAQMNTDAAALKETIANGRKMMPKFSGKLDEAEIDAMVAFIQSNQHN